MCTQNFIIVSYLNMEISRLAKLDNNYGYLMEE